MFENVNLDEKELIKISNQIKQGMNEYRELKGLPSMNPENLSIIFLQKREIGKHNSVENKVLSPYNLDEKSFIEEQLEIQKMNNDKFEEYLNMKKDKASKDTISNSLLFKAYETSQFKKIIRKVVAVREVEDYKNFDNIKLSFEGAIKEIDDKMIDFIGGIKNYFIWLTSSTSILGASFGASHNDVIKGLFIGGGIGVGVFIATALSLGGLPMAYNFINKLVSNPSNIKILKELGIYEDVKNAENTYAAEQLGYKFVSDELNQKVETYKRSI